MYIVIADRQSDRRRFIAHALEYEGYDTRSACSGHQALQLCREPGARLLVTHAGVRCNGSSLSAAATRKPAPERVPVVAFAGRTPPAGWHCPGDADVVVCCRDDDLSALLQAVHRIVGTDARAPRRHDDFLLELMSLEHAAGRLPAWRFADQRG